MVVPSPIYHTNEQETVAALRLSPQAGDLPVMIYSNRLAYRVDVTVDQMEELAADQRFVAIKESSDDIRRSTEIINRFGDRYDLFTGVDNLAFEALSVGAIGWVAGLVTAFPRETVAIYQLMKQGRREEALAIYRWFRPLLDLDVSTYLVQNIKLAEVLRDRHQRPRAHAAHAAVGRAPQGGREDRQGCAGGRPKLPKFADESGVTHRRGLTLTRRTGRFPGGAACPTALLGGAARTSPAERLRHRSFATAPAIRSTTSPSSVPASSASAPPPISPRPGRVTIFDRTGICEETSSGNAAALRLFRRVAACP